jgi:hypothetical protein
MRVTLEGRDRYRWISLGAAGLAVIAGGMAVFGLPPIDLHGPLHWYGIMDPLCGGTRAARYTAMGRWGEAWRYNPLGIATVLVVSLLLLRGATGIMTGRWLTAHITWTRRARRIAIAAAVILLILLEIRQQGRADLLMQGTFTFIDHPVR